MDVSFAVFGIGATPSLRGERGLNREFLPQDGTARVLDFGDFEIIESVEALDDRTVQFRLRETFAPFLNRLTLGIVPEGTDPDRIDSKVAVTSRAVSGRPSWNRTPSRRWNR